MGEAWASTSHCDLTDKRLGAGMVPAPKGTPNRTPGLGPAKDTEGPDPSQTLPYI